MTLLLHGGVWLVGGDQGWFRTVAVAAWGLVPSVAVVAVTVAALWLAVDPVTVSPGDDVGAAVAPLEAQFRAVRPYRTVGAVLSAVWGGLIWRAGLAHYQGLPVPAATVVAGLVALLNVAATVLL